MSVTGWTGGEPDAAAPALPVTDLLLSMRQRGAGDVLAMAAARSYERPDEVPDPDERAANLVARNYAPGQVSAAALRLADCEAELAAEREKLERGARRQEIAMREHAAGRASAMDVQRMLDGDLGDQATVQRLERRAGNLRRLITDAQAVIAPPQRREENAVEAAASRARQTFREVTRAKMAEAEDRSRQRERRPFGGGVMHHAARSEQCAHCTDQGVSDEMSYLLHSDPELNVPVTPPAGQSAADRQKAEADRLQALGYSAETARLAALPYDAGMAVR